MTATPIPPWIAWAREIQALSQTGLTFSTNAYDTVRYTRLIALAAEMLAGQAGLTAATWQENFLAQPGYATPKVDVRGAIIREGKVLLVQERSDERWCLPGGWADVGETPSEMVIREVWEESGFTVVPRKMVGVFDGNRSQSPQEFYHAYKIIFLCELTGGEACPSSETLAVDFFPFAALPPLSSNRTNTRHLAEIEAHLRDPQRPTVFD